MCTRSTSREGNAENLETLYVRECLGRVRGNYSDYLGLYLSADKSIERADVAD